jgi:phage repressor protein C with HTH and peptisase S24 domain
MGWAAGHIVRLAAGETVSFRPHGNSMIPKIYSGQLCTVAPVDHSTLVVGDIVLCKVKGSEFVHLITAIQHDNRFQISNNKGHVNGWISANAIFGKLISVGD